MVIGIALPNMSAIVRLPIKNCLTFTSTVFLRDNSYTIAGHILLTRLLPTFLLYWIKAQTYKKMKG